MNNKIWLLQIPLILLFTFAYWVTDQGVRGELGNSYLRDTVYESLRTVVGRHTDLKFRLRGQQPPRNNIIVLEIDNDALTLYGRWPWHRDLLSNLVRRAFEAGARAVAMDIVFSEADTRVSPELAQLLQSHKLADRIPEFETDNEYTRLIRDYPDRFILGWAHTASCQPAYHSGADNCNLDDPEVKRLYPDGYEKFAFSRVASPVFDPKRTPLITITESLPNLPQYNEAAMHAGSFQAVPDTDGVIRRVPLVFMMNGRPYPSLALELARVALGEDLAIEFDEDHRVRKIAFAKAGREIPVSPLGAMDINFRGPMGTFQYVRASQLLLDPTEEDGDKIMVETKIDRTVASVSRAGLLKDSIVLVGIGALTFDERTFPFDNLIPGVDGHANALDNLLSGDMLVQHRGPSNRLVLFLLMTLGAIVFAFLAQKLESVPALLMFLFLMSGMNYVDLKLLFANGVNWTSTFLYIEYFGIFVLTMALKYVLEERNRKFIRGAFSKYVSPAIVDSILKDPAKLVVGGERKELSILFSDIRGFTTFSEEMDAKKLTSFLNDYLGLMTDIVFEFGGTLDKYIGDAVMAFWGAPLDQPQHALNACKASAKMMQVLTENQERFKRDYGIDVHIGIGVNSGTVSVGNMGSDRIFEYTVIGDHVNLASRMEGLTKYYGVSIVTSRFTFDCITGNGQEVPSHRLLDLVKVKGKKHAVELIQVLDREYPADALAAYAKGRALYANRQWDAAIAAFQGASALLTAGQANQEDGPCQLFVERCRTFKETPPEADWDGSWEMLSK